MGFLYPDLSDQVLTYTADGYNAKQLVDRFTYTIANANAPLGSPTVTDTVDVTVTGASLPTQVGTGGNDTLTATASGTRLIAGAGNDTLNANAASTTVFAGQGDDTVNVNAAKAVVYGGPGANTIKLGSNTAQDTIVLQQGGTDTITGFNLHNGDVLDLRQVFAESQLPATSANLATYVQVTDTGGNATLSFNPAGVSHGPGATLAVLQGVGSGVTLSALVSDGSLKFS